MGVNMNELLLYLDKGKNKRTESLEKFSFIIVGVTLLLSVYDSLTSPVPSRSFIDLLTKFSLPFGEIRNITSSEESIKDSSC